LEIKTIIYTNAFFSKNLFVQKNSSKKTYRHVFAILLPSTKKAPSISELIEGA